MGRARHGPHGGGSGCVGAGAAALRDPVRRPGRVPRADTGRRRTAEQPAPAAHPAPAEVARLTFGVYGTDDEVAAYQSVVDAFNASSTTRKVKLSVLARPRGGPDGRARQGDAPDVFLTSRVDLGQLIEEDAHPAGRATCSTSAASTSATATPATPSTPSPSTTSSSAWPTRHLADGHLLQHRPRRLRQDGARAGSTCPSVDDEGNREPLDPGRVRRPPREFASRAAATRAASGSSPTLQGLAPFIYSGGGKVFDDDDDPTSLAFSDDDTRDGARADAAASCATPTLTLDPRAARASTRPCSCFSEGKLGDDRRLPRPGARSCARPTTLDFDVHADADHRRPAPPSATSTGLCISADTEDVDEAADFIAYAVSDAAIATVARPATSSRPTPRSPPPTPSSQPGRQPADAGSSTSSIRDMVVPPLSTSARSSSSAVATAARASSSPPPASSTSTRPPSRSTRPRSTILAPRSRPSESPTEPAHEDSAATELSSAPSLGQLAPRCAGGSSATSIAAGDDRAGQLDLPRPGAEPAQLRAARPRPARPGSRVAGGAHMHPAQVVGGEQVLHRQLVLLGEVEHRRAGRLEAAVGDRVAVGPGARVRAGRRRGAPGRAGRPRASRAPRCRAATQRVGVALGPAAVEALRAPAARSRSVGIAVAAATIARVGDDPAGRDVALGGDLVAGLPQRAHRARGRGGRAAGARRRYGATPPDAHGRLEAEQVRRTPGGPTRPCRPPRARRPSGRAARRGPRRRGRRTPATARAAAASTSRPRSAPCASAGPARSRPGWRGRRGGSRAGGRRARCRRARSGRSPTSRRHGRSWVAACRIHSVPVEGLLRAGPATRRRSGRPARCRRPRGAAGSGRRGWSSGSPTPARRRWRPGRCRGERRARLGEAGVGVGDAGQPVAQHEQRRRGGLARRRPSAGRSCGPVDGSSGCSVGSSGGGVCVAASVRCRAARAGSGWR